MVKFYFCYMYPSEIVLPMKKELTDVGFEELLSKEAVDSALKKEGTTLVMINSVCGCSAGNARPAAKYAKMQNEHKKPDFFTTVFAGFDIESVARVRENTVPYPPSSPSMALFKNGKLVHFIERHQIEGNTAEGVAKMLLTAFEQHC